MILFYEFSFFMKRLFMIVKSDNSMIRSELNCTHPAKEFHIFEIQGRSERKDGSMMKHSFSL